MSYADTISNSENMYIIPVGCQSKEDVITIDINSSSLAVRVAVYFPHDKYQVITDQTLKERKINLQEYIEKTESWRKQP